MLLAPKQVRFQFIAEHGGEFPVTQMCRELDVSASGFYAWRKRPPSVREMANQELFDMIKAVYNDNREVYGSPRIYRDLRCQGVSCGENRVARLMRLRGLRAKQSRRFKSTTRRNKAHAVAPNLLRRDFSAHGPNQKWLADITYIYTGEGWLYLAVVLDLYARRIVGWAMSDRMTSKLTMSALKMALLQRRPGAGLMHHSDQGSQYTDWAYRALLESHGIQASMNSVGSWWDNAPTESFFGTLKSELVYHCAYHSRVQARTDVFSYIESFYNLRRRHSSLDYHSPDAYEQLFYQEARAFA
jgi:putative transposase